MTPLHIEIGLHYHCSAIDFPRLGAPAVDEYVEQFVTAGLLKHSEGPVRFRSTSGLAVWVAALLSVPWPEQRWMLPSPPMQGEAPGSRKEMGNG